MAARAPSAGTEPIAGVPVKPGDVIAEKYVVERVIGAGGVGVVVAASHTGLGDRVAIKLLQKSAQSEENLARFAREARALARIKSENVARVMDTGSLPSGEPFMVMELLEGQDLAAVLRARTRLPVVEAVDYVVQACEALAVAHGVAIVHRDIKPANLFLSRASDGTPIVKVLDFGISKLRDGDGRDQAMTQTLSVIGSPLYMSPEQMERPRDADARSDIWSLGVILYELMTGKPPFEATTMPMLCARICTAAPTPLAEHDIEVPPDLAFALLRCLEKAPDKRFASVAMLASAIAPFGFESTRQKAEHVVRIARAAGLPVELEGAVAQESAESPADRQPESMSPRRLAWDSSPPPAPTLDAAASALAKPAGRWRRARLTSVSIGMLFVLFGLALWSQRPEHERPVAAAAVGALSGADDAVAVHQQGEQALAVEQPAVVVSQQPVTTEVVATPREPLAPVVAVEPAARPLQQRMRPTPPYATNANPNGKKAVITAPAPGRHDDVLSER